MKKRKIIFNLIFVFLLIAVPLFIGEMVFRYFVFSKSSPFEKLKKPEKYTKACYDDYWKLRYKFGNNNYLPSHPHPLLGWIGFFDRETLEQNDIMPGDSRRKILIYGDSYIMCQHDSVECFHDILNADTTFNKNNFLVNYGVGGYGTDQIYLLFSKTVDKFQNPFVIFSIMPNDMDRCLLSLRDGQKPYFVIENDSLVLKGVPIYSIPEHFFEEHPPQINSYLWARFTHSKLNPYYDSLTNDNKMKAKIMELNKKIILKSYGDIKRRNLQYVFVIFDELWNEEGNWRVDSLKKFLAEQNILFINSGNLVAEDTSFAEYDYARYTIKGDGHPNSYYNKLLCKELKKYIFDYSTYPLLRQNIQIAKKEDYTFEYYEKKIRENKNWLKQIEEKAKNRGVSLDSMVKMDALWMLEEDKKKKTQ